MTYASVIELAIGVAVAKVTTRRPWVAAQVVEFHLQVAGAA